MTAYQEIFEFIKNNSDWSIEAIQAIFIGMAKLPLGPLQEDQLLRQIQKRAKDFGLAQIRQEFAIIRVEHGLAPTDIGVEMAKTVLSEQFHDGRYLMRVPGIGFYQFNDTHWVPISDKGLRKRIMGTVLTNKPRFDKSAASMTSEVLVCLIDITDTYEPTDFINPVINTLNHEIWLSKNGTYELKPHSPDSRLFYCLPYNFEENAKSPLYDKSIREIFAKSSDSEDVVRHWHEFLGYVIQPDRFIPSVWFLRGSGSNGKSTCLKILMSLLGPTVHSCDMRSFMNDNFKYRALFGKLLLVDEDFSQNLILNEAFLKKTSEASMLSARSPHKLDTVTFKNTAVSMLVGNHDPQCNDLSHGWSRRVNVFPFDRKFEKHEVDPDLFTNIVATEMPGVLRAALAGYGRICQRGRKLEVPEDCQKAARQFLEHSNHLLMYVRNRLEPEAKSYIRLSDIRVDLLAWADTQGIDAKVPGKNLKSQFEKLGFIIGPMDGHNCVKGVRLTL